MYENSEIISLFLIKRQIISLSRTQSMLPEHLSQNKYAISNNHVSAMQQKIKVNSFTYEMLAAWSNG